MQQETSRELVLKLKQASEKARHFALKHNDCSNGEVLEALSKTP